MEIIAVIFFFIFGTIIGSFLNVVILRYNTGKTLGGRSSCFSCGNEIKWYDLVPIWSFIFLNGRCRFCKSKISVQYILVELLTGFVFLAIYLTNVSASSTFLLFYFSIFSLFIVIAVYDLKHKIIPDIFAFLLSALSLIWILATVPFSSFFSFPHILDLLAGPILAFPLFLLWIVSSGRWIGLGDAKLALGIGWFLGLSLGISSLVVGFWIGAVISIILIGFSKLSQFSFAKRFLNFIGMRNVGMKSEVPLAPFLIAGVFVVFFWQYDVMGLSALIQQL